MSERFAELFEQSLHTTELDVGKVITGVVMGVDHERVLVHVGLKSEGAVPLEQFRSEGEDSVPVVGDEVQVMLETIDDGRGNTVLSREKARAHKIWQELCVAHEEKRSVKGVISTKVRGGFMVDIDTVRCFLPGSLVDATPLKDITHLEGRELDFRVIRVEEDRNNVVLSRRALLEEQTQEERDALFNSLVEGEVRSGVVKNMTDYGVFVDLGGMDGLLHITDMSWRRLGHPDEATSVGDEIQVKILKIDPETRRISLGMKQLENDPWEDLEQRYQIGTRINVRIAQVLEYGCFAEVESGVEGLIHISEMDWTTQTEHPSRLAKVGDTVEVMILEIDSARHRISLSMKRCAENPWEGFAKEHQKGECLEGTVKSVTDFGVFVELEGGVSGLVHISDLTGGSDKNEDEEALLRQYNRGDKVDVLIIAVDADRERIALSVNQLNDPVSLYVAKNPIGSDVSGDIVKVTARSIVLTLADDVAGVVYASEVDEEHVEDLREHYQNGSSVTARVIDVDHRRKRVTLSIKAHAQDSERAALEDYRRRQSEKESASKADTSATDKQDDVKADSKEDKDT